MPRPPPASSVVAGPVTQSATAAAASNPNGNSTDRARMPGFGPPHCAALSTTEGVRRHSAGSLALPTARNKHKKMTTLHPGATSSLEASGRENNVPGKQPRGRETGPLLSDALSPPNYISSKPLRRQPLLMVGVRLDDSARAAGGAQTGRVRTYPQLPSALPRRSGPLAPSTRAVFRGDHPKLQEELVLQVPRAWPSARLRVDTQYMLVAFVKTCARLSHLAGDRLTAPLVSTRQVAC